MSSRTPKIIAKQRTVDDGSDTQSALAAKLDPGPHGYNEDPATGQGQRSEFSRLGTTPSVHPDNGLMHVDRFNASAWGGLGVVPHFFYDVVYRGMYGRRRCALHSANGELHLDICVHLDVTGVSLPCRRTLIVHRALRTNWIYKLGCIARFGERVHEAPRNLHGAVSSDPKESLPIHRRAADSSLGHTPIIATRSPRLCKGLCMPLRSAEVRGEASRFLLCEERDEGSVANNATSPVVSPATAD